MKILVTGGAGFIGSNLVDALIEKSHEVSVVDNLSTGSRDNVNKNAKLFEADITDADNLDKIFSEIKPEVIFHLAAQASVIVSAKDPALDIKTNVIGTVNLLMAAKQYKVKKFIFSSTGGAIYGDKAERPTTEKAESEPVSPYGIDKLFAERFIKYFSDEGLQSVVLRYANVFGPRQNPKGEAGIVAIFTAGMILNEKLNVFGDGTHTRDFVYVGDVVNANLLAMESDVNDTFNVGTGSETSVNGIVEIIKELAGSKSEIAHIDYKAAEQEHSSLDASKIKESLGWKPRVTLKDGLQKTIEWFIDNSKGKK